MTIRMLANIDNAWRLVALLFIDHYTIISQLTNWKRKELYCLSLSLAFLQMNEGVRLMK